MDKALIFTSKRALLDTLGVRENFLYPDFSSKYHEVDHPKKSGGFRKIKPPVKRLKVIQRIILDDILIHSIQLDCVYGLSKSKDLKANALLHKNCVDQFLLSLDITDFFPSLTQKRVLSVFRKIGFSSENAAILTKLCTIDQSLPQGAPTSPYLASLICQAMDKKIYNYCLRRQLVYSRYFDDITISSQNITDSQIQDIKRMIEDSGLKCNDQKTHLLLPMIKEKLINGVLVNSKGISVSSEYKKEIEDCYRNLMKNKDIQSRRIFSGKFGFYLYINRKEALSYKKVLESKYGVLV